MQRSYTVSGTTTTESYLYTYLTSGANSGKISSVLLRRKVGGGSYATVREVDYAYYGSGDSNGNLGDLQTAIVKDASGNTLDESYYRYYTSDTSIGFTGGLKYVFDPVAFAQLAAAVSSPLSASDATICPGARAVAARAGGRGAGPRARGRTRITISSTTRRSE